MKIELYTGCFSDRGAEHFHAKLYAKQKQEDKKTIIYYGSANLTEQAHKRHWELLMRLEAPEDEYKILNSIFRNHELVQEYDPDCADDIPAGDDLADSCDDPLASANARSKVYVSRSAKGFLLHLGNASYHFGKAAFYVEVGNNALSKKMIYICPENYDNAAAEKADGGLTYEEYAELAEKNIDKDKLIYDKNVFLGKKTNKLRRGNGRRERASKAADPIPCFYTALYSRLAQNGMKLKKALEEMRTELYSDKYIGFVDELLKKQGVK